MLVVEAIAHELSRYGVEYVFGIPGRESVRLGFELERLGVRFVSTRHETQAVMMADGYWRASGKIGVCLLAQGAGFSNGVSGMACAAKARSGILVICGDALTSDRDADDPKAIALQNIKGADPRMLSDGARIKHIRPSSADTFVDELRGALDLAGSGTAISLLIPSDLFSKPAGEAKSASNGDIASAPVAPRSEDVEMVAEMLGTSWVVSRPVVLTGRGAVRSGALPALRQLAEQIGALLATTLMGRSAFRGEAYDIGVCGTFATPVASQYLREADCILAFGASLNPYTTYGNSIFSKKAHIIQIDRDESAMGKYFEPELAIHSDARLFAEELEAELRRRGHKAVGFRTDEVAREIAGYELRSDFDDQSARGLIDPRTLMVQLSEVLPQERTLVIDAGLHLHYACTFFDVQRPEDFIFPIDSGAVGLGMGTAVGVAMARRDRITVLEIGDGGLMMSLGDLDTAIRLQLPIVVVISNDQGWGAEAQHLGALGLPDNYVRIATPSFADLAVVMGAEGHTITSPADLEGLRDRFTRPIDRPIVLDCRVNPEVQPATMHFDPTTMHSDHAGGSTH
jgi:acetolactate synthase-1/2/3 large subunit